MTDKIPESLAVLDRCIAYMSTTAGTGDLRKARAAFAELIDAGKAIPAMALMSDCGCETCTKVARFNAALAAVEVLP